MMKIFFERNFLKNFFDKKLGTKLVQNSVFDISISKKTSVLLINLKIVCSCLSKLWKEDGEFSVHFNEQFSVLFEYRDKANVFFSHYFTIKSTL